MTRGFYTRCEELEAWMAKHRDSVIGTTDPSENDVANVPVTCRPGVWYIHIGPKHKREEVIVVKTTQPVEKAYVMRSGEAISYTIAGEACQFHPPAGDQREVVVLEFAEVE